MTPMLLEAVSFLIEQPLVPMEQEAVSHLAIIISR